MTNHDRDRCLRDAGGHLAKAVQTLQDAGRADLQQEAFRLANAVLHARQALRPPHLTMITRAEA